jgi:hypothetical protein
MLCLFLSLLFVTSSRGIANCYVTISSGLARLQLTSVSARPYPVSIYWNIQQLCTAPWFRWNKHEPRENQGSACEAGHQNGRFRFGTSRGSALYRTWANPKLHSGDYFCCWVVALARREGLDYRHICFLWKTLKVPVSRGAGKSNVNTSLSNV